MTSFYATEELVKVVKGITEEACQLMPTERAEHYMAYEGIVSKVEDEAVIEKIIGNTPRDFFEGTTVPIYLKMLFEKFECVLQSALGQILTCFSMNYLFEISSISFAGD
jgi:hypothetical protein